MDVLRLDATTYLPDSIVEGYTSMIWTERFIDAGEFELKTAKVAETMALIPELSLISLRDSYEVMVVESHAIGVDADGIQELTITGRTLDTFLENRSLLPTVYGEKWAVYRQYVPSDFCALLVWMHIVNTSNEDPTRAAATLDDKLDIANTITTNSVTGSETSSSWSLEVGDVFSTVRGLLALSNLGIRTLRPNSIVPAYVMTFDTTRTVSRGTPTKTLAPNVETMLRFDIYNGLDRTRQQSTNDPIIFHYDSGHIEEASYLFSSKELKNMAKLYSSAGNVDVYPLGVQSNINGFNRRSLLVDGGEQGSMLLADFNAANIQKAQIELKKYNRAVLFDGAISPLSPYKYNSEYFLGDKVTLIAEYGYEASMQVSEYVRTEDAEGDRGYPGLVLAI